MTGSPALERPDENVSDMPNGKENDARPRILFLCQSLPFPPDEGAHIRSYHTLRILAKRYSIRSLFFFRNASRASERQRTESVRHLARFGPARAFPIPQDQIPFRLFLDHARSVLLGRPYTVFTYRSRPFLKHLRQQLDEWPPDLIHMDSLDLSDYLKEFVGIPVACTHHNIESTLLERRSKYVRSSILRRYLKKQSVLMREEEQSWCPRVALNVTVSEVDQVLLKAVTKGVQTVVIPNGVDTEHFRPDFERDTDGILFVGGYNWFPNRDGMYFFLRDILPALRASISNVEITWVGRFPSPEKARVERRFGIRVTGYVEDIRPILRRARCVIAPLRVGGGSRLKIIEAWAMGKAVVSTPVGCEGLDAVDGENILIRDDADGFARAVVKILAEDRQRQKLEMNGRLTAERAHSWDAIGDTLLEAYGKLMAE